MVEKQGVEVEINQEYVDQIEKENNELRAKVSLLEFENRNMRKDIETLTYIATVNSAQVDIFRARLQEIGSDPNEI